MVTWLWRGSAPYHNITKVSIEYMDITMTHACYVHDTIHKKNGA